MKMFHAQNLNAELKLSPIIVQKILLVFFLKILYIIKVGIIENYDDTNIFILHRKKVMHLET